MKLGRMMYNDKRQRWNKSVQQNAYLAHLKCGNSHISQRSWVNSLKLHKMVCFIIHWQFLNLRSITLIVRIPPSAHQKKSYSLFNLVKVAIRRHVGTGGIVLNAEDCINFLERKYQSKENPNFVLKLISKESLLSARQGDQFSTTQGSSKFHVMIFSPNSNSFKAAL